MTMTGSEFGLTAAVLVGGKSSRMGTDKALLPLMPNGPPLLRLVLDQVSAVADEVMLVGEERPGYGGFGVPVIPDGHPEQGTLGGIATALATASHRHVLVVACDMPFLDAGLLGWMAALPRVYDVLVPRLPGESRQGSGFVFQTLHAIYGGACLPAIERRLTADRRQVIGFFEDVRVQTVELEAVRRFDPDLRSFFNANTPEAAAAARRILDQSENEAIPDGS